jgi:hypothetical protein
VHQPIAKLDNVQAEKLRLEGNLNAMNTPIEFCEKIAAILVKI